MTASLPTKDFYALPIDCFKVFLAALDEETDRARVILAAAWMDQFLEIKLRNEFSEGNSKARDSLFSDNGPFARLSSKLDAAFCAGWIDADVYHDASMIRKLRNDFAHRVDKMSLRDPEISALLQKLKVPHRQFHDWGRSEPQCMTAGSCSTRNQNRTTRAKRSPCPATSLSGSRFPGGFSARCESQDLLFDREGG